MYSPAESPKQANIKTSHGCRCRSFPVEPLSRSPWSVLTNSAISPHVSFSHTLHIQTDTLIKHFFSAIFAHSLLRHPSKVYNSFAESPPLWTRRQVVEEKGSQSSAASSIIVLSHHEDQSLPSHSAARRFCRLEDSHFRILGKFCACPFYLIAGS